MNDYILARHILEGLVHNLNNHLNLILGYSQRLEKTHPELKESIKIYDAGIKIDDTLKNLIHHLGSKALAFEQELYLNKWLDQELEYLQHDLNIKHHVCIEREDQESSKLLKISPLYLSLWYEAVLLKLSSYTDSFRLKTGICEKEKLSCLYIKPDMQLSRAQIQDLCVAPKCELLGMEAVPIQSAWDSQEKALMGLLL